MSLLTLTNLSKSFEPNDIYSGITASIPARARIALVGPNGVGKTTLLRIMLDLEDASAGSVHTARGLRMAYLPQEAQLIGDATLWDNCLTAFSEVIEMRAKLS